MTITEKYHLIGIGGIGMSGLAKILLKKNQIVSGSDIAETQTTKELQEKGATVFLGHHASYLPLNAIVVYSSGIDIANPEYQEAKNSGYTLIHRSDLLKQLMSSQKTFAVAGTHGKTTTSALLSWVLKDANLDPSYAVGGILPNTQSNGDLGSGEYFVAEADESDGTFVKYFPYGGILTNIGLDHLDHYGSEEVLLREFQMFCQKVIEPDFFFWCGDDMRLQHMQPPGQSYGFNKNNDLQITNVRQNGWKQLFDLRIHQNNYYDIEIQLLGAHNVLNSAAVFGLALKACVEEESIRRSFNTFLGVQRRCEKKGEVANVLVLDDYAHHPTEIATTLQGVRSMIGDRRLIAVFQPHRYSRTRDCLGTYGGVFQAACEVLITDVHAAGEKPIDGVSPEEIMKELPKSAQYVSRDFLLMFLQTFVRADDVVVTLGAGNITSLSSELVQSLTTLGVKQMTVGVLFGGQSIEHDISINSSKYVLDALQKTSHRVEKIYLPKNQAIDQMILQKILECDLLFPVVHGVKGEDGTLQGLLEMLNKPYIGCDFRASAICMDKSLAKDLSVCYGVPTAPYLYFSRSEWERNRHFILEKVQKTLQIPLYVKGVHLGSSLGVYPVLEIDKLPFVIDQAFLEDDVILIENEVKGREIEFLVTGNGEIIVHSPCEVHSQGHFCGFSAKYGQEACPLESPARLSEKELQKGQELAKEVYRMVRGEGWCRIDFFLTSSGDFFLNEVNPIPGCTQTSAVPVILNAEEITPTQFIRCLIRLGLQKYREKSI